MVFLTVPTRSVPTREATPLADVTAYITVDRRAAWQIPGLGSEAAPALLEVGSHRIPLIDYQIERFRKAGMRTIVAACGTQRDVAHHVESRFKDVPDVYALTTALEQGAGGNLLDAMRNRPELYAGIIVVANADTILDLDWQAFVADHYTSGAAMSIALTKHTHAPNQNGWYVDNANRVIYSEEVAVNTRKRVEAAVQASWRGSNTGALAVNTAFLSEIPWPLLARNTLSLYSSVVGAALSQDKLAAYDNDYNFCMDTSTPEGRAWLQSNPQEVDTYLAKH